MTKQLNDEELNQVSGGHIKYGDIGNYVGQILYFTTSASAGSFEISCGWVKVLAYDDPYVYAEPCDRDTYVRMQKAYLDGCALEPCIFNGTPHCFKINYGTWHITYLHTEKPVEHPQ